MPSRPEFRREPRNPIVVPGGPSWRLATVFNPGAIEKDGKVYLLERAAGSLRPFICRIGLLESDDGVAFRQVGTEPVFTPDAVGSAHGSVQDPRVVKLEGRYYMTFAYRPYAWSSHPTGVGVPDSHQTDFPGFDGDPQKNQTRSGLAVSDDLVHWEFLGLITAPELDDRDVILFPQRIGGRYAMLRRPLPFLDPSHRIAPAGSIQLSYSQDLKTWSEPEVVAEPRFAWEGSRIGGCTPPLYTPRGWLVLYHGVERVREAERSVIYRMGAMLLDLENPTHVLARCPEPLMEPETYYEKFGLYIPNVIFPTGAIVKGETLHLYYGVCDTAIALATVNLKDLIAWVQSFQSISKKMP